MMETTRDQQVLLQAYFGNKGSSIELYNEKNHLTNRSRAALIGLINSGAIFYTRDNKYEKMEMSVKRSDIDYGERMLESDDFTFLEPATEDFVALIKKK